MTADSNTRNTGIVAIDPATTDAVGAAILVLVDDRGEMRIQWQAVDLEHLPSSGIRDEISSIIHASMSIVNSPGFTR